MLMKRQLQSRLDEGDGNIGFLSHGAQPQIEALAFADRCSPAGRPCRVTASSGNGDQESVAPVRSANQ